jgi:4-hydroxybenzoate polyprenyltransferase
MERFFSRLLRKGKKTSFIELSRPWNSISVTLFSILGMILTGGSIPNFWFVLPIIVLLIYSGSSALNDVFDIKVDSINMPFRPLERGSLKVKDVLFFCIIMYSLGNIIALSISLQFFLSILLMSVSSILYSLPPISLKDRGFIGNLNLAFASAFTTLYSGYVFLTNNLVLTYSLFIQATSLTFLFAFFSILKDFKDLGGDKIHNKKTIVIKYGMKNASIINIIGTLIFFPITIATFYYLNFQNLLFILLSSILFIAILIPEIKIYKNPTQKTGENSWSLGRFIFLFLIISLFLF